MRFLGPATVLQKSKLLYTQKQTIYLAINVYLCPRNPDQDNLGEPG
jgi:hypothetical protein